MEHKETTETEPLGPAQDVEADPDSDPDSGYMVIHPDDNKETSEQNPGDDFPASEDTGPMYESIQLPYMQQNRTRRNPPNYDPNDPHAAKENPNYEGDDTHAAKGNPNYVKEDTEILLDPPPRTSKPGESGESGESGDNEPIYEEIKPDEPLIINLGSATKFYNSFPEDYIEKIESTYSDHRKYKYINYSVNKKSVDLEGKYIQDIDIVKNTYLYQKLIRNELDDQRKKVFVETYGYITFNIGNINYHLIKIIDDFKPLRFPHEGHNKYYTYWIGGEQPADHNEIIKKLQNILQKLHNKEAFVEEDDYHYYYEKKNKGNKKMILQTQTNKQTTYALFETDNVDKYNYLIYSYDDNEQLKSIKMIKFLDI